MDEPIYLRMGPDLRRSIYYVIASAPLLAIVGAIGVLAREASLTKTALWGLFLLFVFSLPALFLRWAMRIDDRGIARRRLWAWDLWTWDDFGSGRIRKQRGYHLWNPARPWWRRTLSLDLLAEADRADLLERINVVYPLPPDPLLPPVLEIRGPLYGTTRFDAQGIHIRDPGVLAQKFYNLVSDPSPGFGTGTQGPGEYLWDDVLRLHITRHDRLRHDFSCLMLELPGREIRLFWTGDRPTWRGADAEVIAEFLLRHVPEDRIDVDRVGDPPSKRIDVERQLARLARDQRDMKRCVEVGGVALGALIIWMAVSDGIARTLYLAGLCSLLMVLVCPFVLWSQRLRCRQAEQELARFDQAEEP